MGESEVASPQIPLPEITPVPGGEPADSMLWDVKTQQTEENTLKEAGVRGPDGVYYKFEHGESFSLDRLKDGNGRVPMVTLENGAIIPFKQWKEEVESKNEQDKPQENSLPNETQQENTDVLQSDLSLLGRDRLNNIVRMCSGEKDKLFGKDVVLSEEDKQEILKVIGISRNIIEKAIASESQYEEFAKIRGEVLKNYPWIVPGMFVDGGPNSPIIRQALPNGTERIVMPTNLYRINEWQQIIRNTESGYVRSSSDAMYGTSARSFGVHLSELAQLLKSSQSIGDNKSGE